MVVALVAGALAAAFLLPSPSRKTSSPGLHSASVWASGSSLPACRRPGCAPPTSIGFATGVRRLGSSHWAMILGHVGLAVSIIGIACTQNYSIGRTCGCRPGIASSSPITNSSSPASGENGPNYDGFKGVLEVHRDGKQVALLKPEADVHREPHADDRGGHRCGGFTGISMRRSAKQLEQRRLGGADLLQTLRALDLVWRRLRWPSAACWPCWTKSATGSGRRDEEAKA